jgi:hypothetical protein
MDSVLARVVTSTSRARVTGEGHTEELLEALGGPHRRWEELPHVSKKRPTPQIVEVYRLNKERLTSELQKPDKDRLSLNNIQAYRHIIQCMEDVYDLGGSRVA